MRKTLALMALIASVMAPAVAADAPYNEAADGRLLYATAGGELADARKLGDAGVLDFFTKVAARHR